MSKSFSWLASRRRSFSERYFLPLMLALSTLVFVPSIMLVLGNAFEFYYLDSPPEELISSLRLDILIATAALGVPFVLWRLLLNLRSSETARVSQAHEVLLANARLLSEEKSLDFVGRAKVDSEDFAQEFTPTENDVGTIAALHALYDLARIEPGFQNVVIMMVASSLQRNSTRNADGPNSKIAETIQLLDSSSQDRYDEHFSFIHKMPYARQSQQTAFRVLSRVLLEAALPRNLRFDALDFRDVDFCRMDLRKLEISFSSFEICQFIASNFAGTRNTAVYLDDCDIRAAHIAASKWTGCSFRGADLSYANMFNSSFKICNFSEANLKGVSLKAMQGKSVDFYKCNFAGANLSAAIGLTEHQMGNCFGNELTQLPPGVAAPTRWLEMPSDSRELHNLWHDEVGDELSALHTAKERELTRGRMRAVLGIRIS